MQVKPSQKLTPKDFVSFFLPFAKQAQVDTGISAIAMLAQGAWESGWNGASPGWMLFGVKDTDGVNGNEQLLTTTEYSRRQDLKFPEIISVTPVIRNGVNMFKYKVKDYFRKYDTPADCFRDHGKFFLSNKRYSEALKVKEDPYKFFDAIATAGYATDPSYAANLKSIVKTIEKYL
jgi:flagellum-specific peptidoglycan hydrolase FlgJ